MTNNITNNNTHVIKISKTTISYVMTSNSTHVITILQITIHTL